MKPTDNLKCLLVHPIFSSFSFWNYIDACELIGAKAPSPPLGLLTLAAILPQHWEFRLLDLNTRKFSDADWQWADVVMVGGMLPQQKGILEIIRKAREDNKFVVVGGPDPSSQPQVYRQANAVVLGEAEDTVPRWLEAWENGSPEGIFQEKGKPDVTTSPTPRYDLLRFEDYVQIGVQYSRGCPFNCEFCDIIELYGRKPRTKTPEQVLRELDRLKELGYSGAIDIVDDNFIGNKRAVKRDLLPALIQWNKKNRSPFFYCTEASMNMADDEKLLEAMRDAEFRVIFMGIETPDPALLIKTQKSQNTMGPIVERVQTLYKYGMVATAGFIMGFDGEPTGMDKSMIKLIEETGINMAMVGLLVALPNTQLTRRLLKEKRLLSFQGKLIHSEDEIWASATAQNSVLDVVDQTVAGLNFVTTRDRLEILSEYKNVVESVYAPKAYFDRLLRTGLALKTVSKHRPRWFEIKRQARGLVRLSRKMSANKETRWLFWRNFMRIILRGPHVIEQVLRVTGIYLHFAKQVKFLSKELERTKQVQRDIQNAMLDRSA